MSKKIENETSHNRWQRHDVGTCSESDTSCEVSQVVHFESFAYDSELWIVLLLDKNACVLLFVFSLSRSFCCTWLHFLFLRLNVLSLWFLLPVSSRSVAACKQKTFFFRSFCVGISMLCFWFMSKPCLMFLLKARAVPCIWKNGHGW